MAVARSKAPSRYTGLSLTAKTIACSGVRLEPLLLGIECDVAVGSLCQCPFAHVALGQPGFRREVGSARGTMALKGVKEAQPEADADRRHAERASQIPKHLSDQYSKLVVVDITHGCAALLKRWSGYYLVRSIDRKSVGRPTYCQDCRPSQG